MKCAYFSQIERSVKTEKAGVVSVRAPYCKKYKRVLEIAQKDCADCKYNPKKYQDMVKEKDYR